MAQYDPVKHRRRSIRLRAYDYASAGAYFITIVTHRRRHLFGRVEAGAMRLNRWGEIVAGCWTTIPRHFRRVTLDEWVVMPNHLHGILIIRDGVAAQRKGEASARTGGGAGGVHRADASPLRPRGTRPGSIGAIIQNVKSVSARRIRMDIACGSPPHGREGPATLGSAGLRVWHRNYYERVIRDARGLERIRRYIRDNPRAWAATADER